MQAGVDIPSVADCTAGSTGPLHLQLQFEQTIDGYIFDGYVCVVPVEKSQLSVEMELHQPLSRLAAGSSHDCRGEGVILHDNLINPMWLVDTTEH